MSQPRKSANRVMLGVRWKRAKDRRCARLGHTLCQATAQRQMSGMLWPVCTRCGYAIEQDRWER